MTRKSAQIRHMVLAGIFASLIALCAWISVPVPPVAFTLQTFGVLLALGLLGGKWGCVSIFLYLLMGCVGLPVFASFRGGLGALLDPGGGFLWGFLLGGLGYWAAQKLGKLPAMITALLLCYFCGSWWFARYAGVDLPAAAAVCVLPWVIPDAFKLALALHLTRRLGKGKL